MSESEQPYEAEVEPPNSVPTGSRFETSTESYAAGFPDIPEPQWLIKLIEERRNRLGIIEGFGLPYSDTSPDDNHI